MLLHELEASFTSLSSPLEKLTLTVSYLPILSMVESALVKAIYTDGACSGNPGPGGWGVVIQLTDGQQQELGGGVAQTTNNQMELQAAIEAVKALTLLPQRAEGACIYTDSEYVKNGILKWLPNWKKRNWQTAQGKPVLNQEFWKELDALNPRQIDWQHIKAHTGHPGNERADSIARAFSLKQNPQLSQIEQTQNHSPRQSSSLPTASPLLLSEADLRSQAADSLLVQTQQDTPAPRKGEELITVLQALDLIADRSFLVTSAELADLLNLEPDVFMDKGEAWIWRNWQGLPVREEEGQILWQLKRVFPASDHLS